MSFFRNSRKVNGFAALLRWAIKMIALMIALHLKYVECLCNMCDVCQCWLLALLSSQSSFSNQMNCQMNYIKLEGGLCSTHKSSSLSNWSLSFEQLIGKCFNVVKTSLSQNVCTITLFQAFFLIVRRLIKLTYCTCSSPCAGTWFMTWLVFPLFHCLFHYPLS